SYNLFPRFPQSTFRSDKLAVRLGPSSLKIEKARASPVVIPVIYVHSGQGRNLHSPSGRCRRAVFPAAGWYGYLVCVALASTFALNEPSVVTRTREASPVVRWSQGM